MLINYVVAAAGSLLRVVRSYSLCIFFGGGCSAAVLLLCLNIAT